MSYRFRRRPTYRIAQLRAISRRYTAKYRKEAIADLAAIGVDFDDYCAVFGYKGSPRKLINDYRDGAKRTVANVRQYLEGKEAASC